MKIFEWTINWGKCSILRLVSDFLVTTLDTHLERFFRLCSYENEGFDLNHLIKFDKLSNKQMTGLLCIQRKALENGKSIPFLFSTPLTDMDWWVKLKKFFASDLFKDFGKFYFSTKYQLSSTHCCWTALKALETPRVPTLNKMELLAEKNITNWHCVLHLMQKMKTTVEPSSK